MYGKAITFIILLFLIAACNKKDDAATGNAYGSWTGSGKTYKALSGRLDTTVNHTISLSFSDDMSDDLRHMVYLELPPVAVPDGSYTLDAGIAGSMKIHAYTYSKKQQRILEQHVNEKTGYMINRQARAAVATSGNRLIITVPEIWLFNGPLDSMAFTANLIW